MFSVKAMLPIIVMGIGLCGLAECVSDEEIATRIVLANSYVGEVNFIKCNERVRECGFRVFRG